VPAKPLHLFALLLAPAMLAVGGGITTARGQSTPSPGSLVFNHVLDNSVIEFSFKPNQAITEAVAKFHKTAVNDYNGKPEALAEGKSLYDSTCAACHLKDASGRIGPNLIDDEWRYPQVATDKGTFEIIYAGGAGAMQAFGKRLTQDQILRIMAYVHSLRGK
jgi:cytochrome c-L